MTKYEKNAFNLAKKYNIEKKILDVECKKYFPDDKEKRDVYTIKLSSPFHSYIFTFGDSIANTNRALQYGKCRIYPSFYDIFACTQKYEVPKDIDGFISEYGYTADYGILNLINLHNAVKLEYENFSRLFENGIIPDDILEIC